jgi:hypothetical protein
LEDLGIDKSCTLKFNLSNKNVRLWAGFSWLRIRSISRDWEKGIEPSDTKEGPYISLAGGIIYTGFNKLQN